MINNQEFPPVTKIWDQTATISQEYVRMDFHQKRQQDLLEANNRLLMENRALKSVNQELVEQSMVTYSEKEPKIAVNWSENAENQS